MRAVLLCTLPVCLCGCETISQRQREEMQRQEDFRVLREDLRIIKGRLDTLELETERLDREVYQTRTSAAEAARGEVQMLSGRVAELEQRLETVDRNRKKDKQEIIDTLSRKMADLIKKSTAARSSGRTRRSSEYGYEHVVQPGETLSEIAAAYGTSMKAIINENGLRNPDRLTAGQKLFIPE